jgi:hypothetical protein
MISMSLIFLSYRRDDSSDVAEQIYNRLSEELDASNVFFDVHSILSGKRWKRKLSEELHDCLIMLVLIGGSWSPSRLFNPGDYVYLEIQTAIKRGIPVTPVILESTGGAMPTRAELPDQLKSLLEYQAFRLGDNPADLNALLRHVVGNLADSGLHSMVIVRRRYRLKGFPEKLIVELDGEEIGRLGPGGEIVKKVLLGRHQLVLRPSVTGISVFPLKGYSDIEFTAKPGEVNKFLCRSSWIGYPGPIKIDRRVMDA